MSRPAERDPRRDFVGRLNREARNERDDAIPENVDAAARARSSVSAASFTCRARAPLRIAIGVALCIFGMLGFLPVLGFWMIPLGLLVLSYEFAAVRRFRRRVVVWWERRRQVRSNAAGDGIIETAMRSRRRFSDPWRRA